MISILRTTILSLTLYMQKTKCTFFVNKMHFEEPSVIEWGQKWRDGIRHFPHDPNDRPGNDRLEVFVCTCEIQCARVTRARACPRTFLFNLSSTITEKLWLQKYAKITIICADFYYFITIMLLFLNNLEYTG